MFLDLINKKKKIEKKADMQNLFYILEVLVGFLLGILFGGGIYFYFYYSTHTRFFSKLNHPWYYYLGIFSSILLFFITDLSVYLIIIKKKFKLKI